MPQILTSFSENRKICGTLSFYQVYQSTSNKSQKQSSNTLGFNAEDRSLPNIKGTQGRVDQKRTETFASFEKGGFNFFAKNSFFFIKQMDIV
jgi:hypothetical protein